VSRKSPFINTFKFASWKLLIFFWKNTWFYHRIRRGRQVYGCKYLGRVVCRVFAGVLLAGAVGNAVFLWWPCVKATLHWQLGMRYGVFFDTFEGAGWESKSIIGWMPLCFCVCWRGLAWVGSGWSSPDC
jgi:hypothetical protein